MQISRLVLVLAVVAAATVVPRTSAQSDVAFPREVYAARRAKLASQLGGGAAVIPGRYLVGASGLFKQDPNFWYLTGVESPYAVLVLAGGRSTLFLPARHQFAGAQYPMADAAFRDAVWNRPKGRLEPGREARRATGVDETYPIDELAQRLPGLVGRAQTVFLPRDGAELYAPPGMAAPRSMEQQFESAVRTLLAGRTVEDLTPALRAMRIVKDAYEISALRTAAAISGEGLVAAMRVVRPGMNDREVAGLMEHAWKRAGSPRAAFAPIVASGVNAMTLFTLMGERYNAVDRVMREGDLLFIDYGAAEFRTYAADLCRTLPVSGRFTPGQRKYYDIVLEAQEAAIAEMRPGVMMVEAVKAAARVFDRHGLREFEDAARMGTDRVWGLMPSPTHYLVRDAGIVRYSATGFGVRDLGHHIGLEVQDGRDYSKPLAPGMVITVEPKLYIPELQIAIMIEDMILITEQGHENLSAGTPKRAEDIERLMAVEPRPPGR